MNQTAERLDNDYPQLEVAHEAEIKALWTSMTTHPRPCFNPNLVREAGEIQDTLISNRARYPVSGSLQEVHYHIIASRNPQVFSLGGDLDLFRRLIGQKDRKGLYDYAASCIDLLYHLSTGYGQQITTIALVRGKAFGGGFELALACNVIVAEKNARMGFPEILFNLFPGMGAFNLVSRKTSLALAEKMIMSGNVYHAEELFELGLVDVLAEDGEGEQAVRDYILRHNRRRSGLQAIRSVSHLVSPINKESLLQIVDIWVDTAMQLGPRDIKTMERLVRAQDQRQGHREDCVCLAG